MNTRRRSRSASSLHDQLLRRAETAGEGELIEEALRGAEAKMPIVEAQREPPANSDKRVCQVAGLTGRTAARLWSGPER